MIDCRGMHLVSNGMLQSPQFVDVVVKYLNISSQANRFVVAGTMPSGEARVELWYYQKGKPKSAKSADSESAAAKRRQFWSDSDDASNEVSQGRIVRAYQLKEFPVKAIKQQLEKLQDGSGFLTKIDIAADVESNRLIVTATEQQHDLFLGLIQQFEQVSTPQ